MKNLLQAIFSHHLPERDIINARNVMLWGIFWTVSIVSIDSISEYEWYGSLTVVIAACVLHTGLGVGMIKAYKKFLRELDEMERKIQLDSLAMSVGITVISFTSFTSLTILARAEIIEPVGADNLIMIMMLTYSIGLIIGRVRYQ